MAVWNTGDARVLHQNSLYIFSLSNLTFLNGHDYKPKNAYVIF